MPASTKVMLILNKPVIFPGLASQGHFTSVLCNAEIDKSSQLAGGIKALDLGVDISGAGFRICIPIHNISAYAYETTEGAFATLGTIATDEDVGFIDVSV